MEKRPWLDYTGQTTAQLLAHKDTHRTDSILCAFESGLLAKKKTNAEEQVVLAAMALSREVNNGGYRQFFLNSKRFVPVIRDALRRIGSDRIAEITQRAIERRDDEASLHLLDQEFFRNYDIDERLLAFIEAHLARIRLARRSVAAAESAVTRLYSGLVRSMRGSHTMEPAIEAARRITAEYSLPAGEDQIRGAAALYLLERCSRAESLAGCEEVARQAFGLARHESLYCRVLSGWVTRLINGGQPAGADRALLEYLEYLRSCEPRASRIPLSYCQLSLRQHAGRLPRSEEFFRANFA